MPVIKQKPSLNHQVIKGMTKKELVEQHPLADEQYLSDQWDIANPECEAKTTKPAKAT